VFNQPTYYSLSLRESAL